MPKCKNNPSRHYKGNERSPKGKGWCASGESIGKKRKGTDGNMWIVKKTKSSKRWVPCVTCKTTKRKHSGKSSNTPLAKKSKQTLDFRMVIGYFKWKGNYSDNTNDTRPYATKEVLEKFIKTQKVWNHFNFDSEFPLVGRESNQSIEMYSLRLGQIRSKNVKSVKVMKIKHNPTGWEKFIRKHTSWWYNPDWVIIVDLVNVPTIRVTKKEASAWMSRKKVTMTNTIDQYFFDDLLSGFNHQSLSAEGWINHVKKWQPDIVEEDPFKGDLSLLQCGPISTTVPDYRQFHIS